MEYILTCLFYLKQFICVSYRMKEEQHIDTIKNYNYNSTSHHQKLIKLQLFK